jgi:hypothetical protein
MPIRINLLAETHAVEEARRRDPVKRVIFLGAILATLILAYSSSLMVQNIRAKGEVTRLEQSAEARKNEYAQVLLNQKNLIENRRKLESLHRLSTNRFLVGTLLNAMQKSTLDNVQLLGLRLSHSYVQAEEVKPKKGQHIAPKPATSTERIVLTLNAKDSSPIPGDAVNAFQKKLAANPYFTEMLGRNHEFRLLSLGSPQTDPEGKPFVLFTLEARFPEKTR